MLEDSNNNINIPTKNGFQGSTEQNEENPFNRSRDLDEEDDDSNLCYVDIKGLAGLAVERKSLMVIHQPISYKQYSAEVDMP